MTNRIIVNSVNEQSVESYFFLVLSIISSYFLSIKMVKLMTDL